MLNEHCSSIRVCLVVNIELDFKLLDSEGYANLQVLHDLAVLRLISSRDSLPYWKKTKANNVAVCLRSRPIADSKRFD